MYECWIKRYVKVAIPQSILVKGIDAVLTALKEKKYAETITLEYFHVENPNEQNITVARQKVGS